jgi:glycosyl transferase family 25
LGKWAAYVINLDRDPDRWRHVSAQLSSAGIPFERIAAVDGRNLTFPIPEFSKRSYALLHGRQVNPFEVGCYLSHLAAMDRFLASGDECGLILEDDLNISEDLPAIVDAARAFAADWDIVRLSTVNRDRWRPVIDIGNGYALGVAVTREKGSGAYLLSRRSAMVMRRRLVPMRLAYDIAFDLEFFWGLRALGVTPIPVQQKTHFKTQIQHKVRYLPGWRYLTVFPYRVGLESSRFVCRAVLYGWLKLKYGRRSAAKPA